MIHRLLIAVLAQLLFTVCAARGTAIRVHNEREMRNAIRQASRSPVTIVVDADRINLGGRHLYITPTKHPLDLVGVPRKDKSNPVIDFKMQGEGDWTIDQTASGIHLNCSSVWVRGLTFTGYEWRGSALRWNGTGLLHVQSCHFEKIATTVRPAQTERELPETAQQVWYGNVIGTAPDSGHVVIDGCTFTDCCTASNYGHAIYASDTTASVTVTNCTFRRVGHVHRSQPEVMRLFNNTYRDMRIIHGRTTC